MVKNFKRVHFQLKCVEFQLVADLVHVNAKNGGRTLVHCLAGMSRSVSLCVAYMMTHAPSERRAPFNTMDVYEALDFVLARRSIGCPNQGFMKQLVKYDPKFTSREVDVRAFGSLEAESIKTIQATINQLEAKRMY